MYNKTIIEFGFRMISLLSIPRVCVIRLRRPHIFLIRMCKCYRFSPSVFFIHLTPNDLWSHAAQSRLSHETLTDFSLHHISFYIWNEEIYSYFAVLLAVCVFTDTFWNHYRQWWPTGICEPNNFSIWPKPGCRLVWQRNSDSQTYSTGINE
jgi:hypothetical protein